MHRRGVLEKNAHRVLDSGRNAQETETRDFHSRYLVRHTMDMRVRSIK